MVNQPQLERNVTTLFTVIESTPGYMPDECDPPTWSDFKRACEYADRLAEELADAGYSCVTFTDVYRPHYYSIRCIRPDTVAPDLGRVITVERID